MALIVMTKKSAIHETKKIKIRSAAVLRKQIIELRENPV